MKRPHRRELRQGHSKIGLYDPVTGLPQTWILPRLAYWAKVRAQDRVEEYLRRYFEAEMVE